MTGSSTGSVPGFPRRGKQRTAWRKRKEVGNGGEHEQECPKADRLLKEKGREGYTKQVEALSQQAPYPPSGSPDLAMPTRLPQVACYMRQCCEHPQARSSQAVPYCPAYLGWPHSSAAKEWPPHY